MCPGGMTRRELRFGGRRDWTDGDARRSGRVSPLVWKIRSQIARLPCCRLLGFNETSLNFEACPTWNIGASSGGFHRHSDVTAVILLTTPICFASEKLALRCVSEGGKYVMVFYVPD